MKNSTIVLIVLASLSVMALSFYLIYKLDPGQKAKPTSEITNIISRQEPIQSFSLVDTKGNIFTDKNLQGKFTVLYFGFATCPDICPYSLEKFRKLSNMIPEEFQSKIQFVFVSIDPQRDDTKTLTQFVNDFGGDKVIGVTGSEEDLTKLSNSLKVYFAKQSDDGKGNYYVDHTSFIYLLDPEAKLISQFSYNAKVDEMIQSINNYLLNK